MGWVWEGRDAQYTTSAALRTVRRRRVLQVAANVLYVIAMGLLVASWRLENGPNPAVGLIVCCLANLCLSGTIRGRRATVMALGSVAGVIFGVIALVLGLGEG